MRRGGSVVAFTLWVLFVSTALCLAHGPVLHEGGAEPPTEEVLSVVVGVDEKTGAMLDLRGQWVNGKGDPANLEEILDLPTLLIPAYYHCPKSCSFLLAAMAAAVRDLDLFPVLEYRVVSISISDDENPTHAALAKAQYYKILGEGYPDAAWPFLVGDKASVAALCGSMGYQFTKKGPHSYIHPNVAIVVAPKGKIIRYLYGPDFLTADLKKGLEEAAEGVPSVSIHRLVTYCFDYDPVNRSYVLNVFRTMGSIILTFVLLLFFYLVVVPSARRSKGGLEASVNPARRE